MWNKLFVIIIVSESITLSVIFTKSSKYFVNSYHCLKNNLKEETSLISQNMSTSSFRIRLFTLSDLNRIERESDILPSQNPFYCNIDDVSVECWSPLICKKITCSMKITENLGGGSWIASGMASVFGTTVSKHFQKLSISNDGDCWTFESNYFGWMQQFQSKYWWYCESKYLWYCESKYWWYCES